MKQKLLLLQLTVLLFAGVIGQTTETRIFVVRHADRVTSDDLNALGVVRANDLKRILFSTGIDSIFSTNFVRTKKTVTPLAEALHLPVLLYDSNPQLLSRVLNYSIGKTVLISGHSNTVAQFIKSCGCTPPFENIPDNQFDNLFLILIQQEKIKTLVKSTCTLLHMKYGAATD